MNGSTAYSVESNIYLLEVPTFQQTRHSPAPTHFFCVWPLRCFHRRRRRRRQRHRSMEGGCEDAQNSADASQQILAGQQVGKTLTNVWNSKSSLYQNVNIRILDPWTVFDPWQVLVVPLCPLKSICHCKLIWKFDRPGKTDATWQPNPLLLFVCFVCPIPFKTRADVLKIVKTYGDLLKLSL